MPIYIGTVPISKKENKVRLSGDYNLIWVRHYGDEPGTVETNYLPSPYRYEGNGQNYSMGVWGTYNLNGRDYSETPTCVVYDFTAGRVYSYSASGTLPKDKHIYGFGIQMNCRSWGTSVDYVTTRGYINYLMVQEIKTNVYVGNKELKVYIGTKEL